MRAATDEVKTPRPQVSGRGISRHVEGWQPALIAIVMAAIVALLVVPRSAAPDTLPLPHLDARESERARNHSRDLARRAATEPLPYLVRGVGETFRAFGRAEAEGRSGDVARKLLELRGLARTAREKHGDDAVLGLLALQTELFLAAVRGWEEGSGAEAELPELGGSLLEKAQASGWMRGERRLHADDFERRALFKVRWVEAAGLRTTAGFSPSANELRTYYRFMLARSGRATQGALLQVAAVEKLDLEYPGQFARGVLYYRGGHFAESLQAFRAHLSSNPDGPWAQRAKNHLLAAAERTRETTPEP